MPATASAVFAGIGYLGLLVQTLQTQVTYAREAAYSGDNKGNHAYVDIRSRSEKKQTYSKLLERGEIKTASVTMQ